MSKAVTEAVVLVKADPAGPAAISKTIWASRSREVFILPIRAEKLDAEQNPIGQIPLYHSSSI
jgi:hypothetical protein